MVWDCEFICDFIIDKPQATNKFEVQKKFNIFYIITKIQESEL